MRTIKRYSNRKLYDTKEKKYITLEQISHLVKDSEDIKVIDNDTGEDLTNVTLSQILVEKEKKKESLLPRSFLAELVKSSSSVLENVRRTVQDWLGNVYLSEETVEKQIERLVKTGELSIEEGKKLRNELIKRTRQFRERIDDLVEEKVQQTLGRLNIPHKADFDALARRIDELSQQLDSLLPKHARKPEEPLQSVVIPENVGEAGSERALHSDPPPSSDDSEKQG